jgi:IS5 family transposase
MKQQTFAAGYFEHYRKRIQREQFLAKVGKVILGSHPCASVELFAPKAHNGRPQVALKPLLSIFFLQHWFNLSDPGAKEALYESRSTCYSVGVDLGREPVPDESTIPTFRHLLQRREVAEPLFQAIDEYIRRRPTHRRRPYRRCHHYQRIHFHEEKRQGTRSGYTFDPQQHPWHFVTKARIRLETKTRQISSVTATEVNVHDSPMLENLLHGDETWVWGDSPYSGQHDPIRRGPLLPWFDHEIARPVCALYVDQSVPGATWLALLA